MYLSILFWSTCGCSWSIRLELWYPKAVDHTMNFCGHFRWLEVHIFTTVRRSQAGPGRMGAVGSPEKGHPGIVDCYWKSQVSGSILNFGEWKKAMAKIVNYMWPMIAGDYLYFLWVVGWNFLRADWCDKTSMMLNEFGWATGYILNILLHGTWEGNSAQMALEFTLKFLPAEKKCGNPPMDLLDLL